MKENCNGIHLDGTVVITRVCHTAAIQRATTTD